MSRPIKSRHLQVQPFSSYFKPCSVPLAVLEEQELAFDELEALRLADLEGLYHEEAAARMHISRQTFGNIVKTARIKVASALVQGMAIRIEGGVCSVEKKTMPVCKYCAGVLSKAPESGMPAVCPHCNTRTPA